MSLARVNGHTFFDRFLSPTSVVIDLGANMGAFSQGMVKRFGCRCYAVEANPDVFMQIADDERVNSFNFAIAKQSGTLSFHISENSQASSLYASEGEAVQKMVTVPAKSLDEFLKEMNVKTLDLLKMDVEGAEIDVLDSCSDDLLLSILQITLEFHDFNGMVSKADVQRLIDRFKGLGFLCLVMTRPSHGHEDVCFINKKRCSISLVEYFWACHISRNVLGMGRILRRKLGRPTKAMATAVR